MRRIAVLVMMLALAGCASDGHFEFLGYTTLPPYDESIRTVYVPIFQNVSFRRGLEFDLTRAVIREIEATTPYKVVNCRDEADTELLGKIINRNKSVILHNPIGETREGELTLAVELIWKDLRPGHVGEFLTRPDASREEINRNRQKVRVQDGLGMNWEAPQKPLVDKLGQPLPVLVSPAATFVPELGGSVASAERQLVERLAIQIVNMMERPW